MDAWSDYWASGAQASCLNESGENYTGAVQQCWQTFFQQLPRCARLLDLATGNGAIPNLALTSQHAPDTDWRIYGVDRARAQVPVDSGWRLLSGVNMESLPFAARMFDAVTAQYAVEYGDREPILAEVRRVLKADGYFQFVMHVDDSRVVQQARLQLEEIDCLLVQWGLFKQVSTMLELHQSGQEQGLAQQRQQFERQAAEAMMRVREGRDSGLLQQSLHLLGQVWQQRNRQTLEQARARLNHATGSLSSLRQRLRDLDAACLRDSDCQDWVDACQRHGLHVATAGALKYAPDSLIAWRLTGRG
ncbi:MAG: hypothetical protein Tsb002_17410 [Wenzhouxiangellaceae bacterium]